MNDKDISVRHQRISRWGDLCLLTVGLWLTTGCQPAAPGIDRKFSSASCSSNVGMDGLHFSLLRHNDQTTVLIVDDLQGRTNLNGTSDNRSSITTGEVQTADGAHYTFRVHSGPGGTTEVRIATQVYDPTQGSLFLVARDGNGVRVRQLQHDLSQLEVNTPAGTAFVNTHRDEFQSILAGREVPLGKAD